MINNLQYLRGIAALLVVVGHTLQLLSEKLSPIASPVLLHFAQTGAIGVDIFFVISGFIMFHVSAREPGALSSTGRFWLRRFVRVVPMYWIVTTVVLCFYLSGIPKSKIDFSAYFVVRSYLLLPVESLRGWMEPIVPAGWTLIYEMFFYFCFGLALLLPNRLRAVAVTAFMGLLVTAGLVFLETWEDLPVMYTYTSTLLLEFLFGVWIAKCHQTSFRIPRWAGLTLAVSGFAVLSLTFTGEWLSRSLISGVPAAVIVFAAVLTRRAGPVPAKPVKSLRLLGDASYSLYLGHVAMLFPISFAVRMLHGDGALLFAAALLGSLALQVTGAIAMYRFLESPITAFLNARLIRKGEAPASSAPPVDAALPAAAAVGRRDDS